jgi:glycosyltransferase involved in cell wall biosynthesis
MLVLPSCPEPVTSGPDVHNLGIVKIAQRLGAVSVVGLVANSTELGHWSTFLSKNRDLHAIALVPRVGKLRSLVQKANSVLRVLPATLGCIDHPSVEKALLTGVSAWRPTVVVFLSYLFATVAKSAGFVKTILIPHDAYSMAYYRGYRYSTRQSERLRFLVAWLAFRSLEKRYYSDFDVVAPVSRVDVRWLKAQRIGASISTLPIPVNKAYLGSIADTFRSGEVFRITCAGVYNNDAVTEAMARITQMTVPILHKAGLRMEWTIWGRGAPPRKILQLASELPSVRLLTWAPDYHKEILRTHLYIYPQRSGSGVQTKLQQVMAASVPVVARRETLLPIGARHMVSVICINDDQELAAYILKFASDENFRNRIRFGGLQHIKRDFSEEVIERKFSRLIEL